MIESLLLAERGARFAYSFFTAPCSDLLSKKPPAPGDVRCGQAADLFAVPLDALRPADTVREWYEAACRVETRFRFHDDLWISLFLHDAANTTVLNVPQLSKSVGHQHNLSKSWTGQAFSGHVHGSGTARTTALRLGGSTKEHCITCCGLCAHACLTNGARYESC